jgi:hypothetical protein
MVATRARPEAGRSPRRARPTYAASTCGRRARRARLRHHRSGQDEYAAARTHARWRPHVRAGARARSARRVPHSHRAHAPHARRALRLVRTPRVGRLRRNGVRELASGAVRAYDVSVDAAGRQLPHQSGGIGGPVFLCARRNAGRAIPPRRRRALPYDAVAPPLATFADDSAYVLVRRGLPAIARSALSARRPRSPSDRGVSRSQRTILIRARRSSRGRESRSIDDVRT